jgi:hypothetical protein
VSPIPLNDDSSDTTVSYFWATTGIYDVSVDLVLADGTTAPPASSQFDVVAPNVDVSLSFGPVEADEFAGIFMVQAGEIGDGGEPGISLSATCDSGSLGAPQIANAYGIALFTGDPDAGGKQFTSQGNGPGLYVLSEWGLDAWEPSGDEFDDSPRVPIPMSGAGAGAYVNVNEAFDAYIVWTPTGGNPVLVKAVHWEFSFSAATVFVNNAWHWFLQNTYLDGESEDASGPLPFWNNLVTNPNSTPWKPFL